MKDKIKRKINKCKSYSIMQSFSGGKDSAKLIWTEFYENCAKFDAPIKNGYAITCHSSQGSTYNKVFVDICNICNCLGYYNKHFTLNRALYTSITRASSELILYMIL